MAVSITIHDYEVGADKTITLSDEQIDELVEKQAEQLKKPPPDKKKEK